MKQILFTLLLLCSFWNYGSGQIQYTGCSGSVAAGYPITLNLAGNDGTRNFYHNTLPGTPCSAGTCAFRVIWTGTQWEIQLSIDGGATYPNVLYANTSASFPDPPDLTLGTWVAQGPCGGQALTTWSGNVQSTVSSGAPEIDVLGNGLSIVDGDVTPSAGDDTDFGNVTVGGNTARTFTISNTGGTAALDVSSINLSGANAGDFAVSGITLPANIAAGATTTFTLTFTPGAAGVRNATVTINNNDADEGTYAYAVQGTGVANPEIDILGNGLSIVNGDITPSVGDDTDFGSVNAGANTVRTFTISNAAGTGVLNVSSIVVSGANAGDFVIGGITLPASVAAGATTTFTATFTPSAGGVRNATVTVNNDDADEGTYSFAIRGTGILPSVAITEWIADPLANDLTDEWVELHNFGATPIDIQNWEIEDEGVDDDVITTTSFIIPAGGYVILARNKAIFEAQWLNGCPSANVIEVAGLTLGNGADEIIIKDNNDIVIWSVAYQNDDVTGIAAHYTEAPTFTNRIWGSAASPGVDRTGNDPATGTLGYENNNATADPNVMTSTTGDMGSPFNGTYTPPTKDLVRGDVLDFDGTDDLVSVADNASLDITGDVTFEAWVLIKGNAATGFHTILDKTEIADNANYRPYINSPANTMGFYNGTTAVNASAAITANEWTHVCWAYDNGTGLMTFYMNGASVFTAATSMGATNDGILRIGTDILGRFSNVLLDEVRIWNTTRTATEVRENMHLTLEDCPTGLVAYYQMNDGTGSSALTDHSGNSNTGTLTNMDPATDWVNSGVNIGNDAGNVSNSQTLAVGAGVSTQNFATANLSIDFTAHSVPEDFTVTYHRFTPNATTGIVGSNIIQNPMWTIDKATTFSTQTMDLTFNFPVATITTVDICQLNLYNRPTGSDGAWTLVRKASTVSGTSVTFSDISLTGQFMVVEDNTAIPADIVRGDVLDFDGIDDYVAIGNLGNVTDWTIETWFRPNGLNNYENIFHTAFPGAGTSDDGVRLELSNNFANGLLYVSVSGNGTFNPYTIVPLGGNLPDEWHHIAIVGDQTNGRVIVYLNGIEVVNSVNANWPASFSNMVLGRGFDANNLDREFSGQLDEVRIWTTTRSANEIRENMHLTLDACANGLLTYYQMNDGVGSATLADKTGNGNTGTLTNMDPATDWAASDVNVGNDALRSSNSQTINVPSGVSTQTFVAANATMRFFQHSATEEITVTYQAFIPNSIVGVNATNLIQNPMWTVNRSNNTSNLVVDYTFNFAPNTFISLNPAKYGLYYRPMNSGGAWTKIAVANTVTNNSVTFGKISLTGQFMVVRESEILVSDVRGNMYEFDGTNFIDHSATATNLPTGNAPRTIEAWIKTTQLGLGNIVSWGRRSNNQRNSMAVRGNVLGFVGELNDYNGTTVINDGAWHHVAITYDGTTMRFYVDGVLDLAVPTATNLNTTDQNLRIGTIALPSSGENYQGSIDEVRIWNVARTQEELRENRHLTLKGSEIGLVSYYQFNTDDPIGTASGVKDGVGTNDGTTVNMTGASYVPSEVAVAGGAFDRILIPGPGVYNLPNTDITIQFDANTPNGEIVVSRLETEKPHGWETIGGDVDDEYFVVNNYGSNASFDPLIDLTFGRMSYISAADAAEPQGNSPLQLFKRSDNAFGATWGATLGGANNATSGTNASVSYNATNNVNSFSQLVIANVGGTSDLPVELTKFEAKRLNADKVALNWVTETEINNQGFFIERMLETESEFKSVTFVDGKGQTTSVTNYQLLDENSFTGVSYYRLRQVDFDGTTTYSQIKAVEGRSTRDEYMDVSIYPNPVQNELQVRFNTLPIGVTSAQITITAASGNVLHNFTADIQSYQLLEINEVAQLPAGLYLLSIEFDNKERVAQKFIKE